MTFFFFVVGLEARREFDLGELRERRRVALPLLAGLGGMAVPVAIYLAFNAGRPSAHGWGVAMSTDTAFALGMLALVGPRFPDRLRAFMLTVVVVDDIVALVVIAIVYTEDVASSALLVGARRSSASILVAARRSAARRRSSTRCSASPPGSALLEVGRRARRRSGSRWACSRTRTRPRASTLERATERFREFREQPTPELARSAQRRAAEPRSRRTSGCSSSTTPGRAT